MLLAVYYAHREDPEVAEYACSALSYFAPTNKATLLADGGLRVLLTAHRNHAGNPVIVNFVCEVLANLTSCEDDRPLIVKRGGLDVLLAALRDHPAHAGIMENGCRALANMTENAEMQAKIEVYGKKIMVLTTPNKYQFKMVALGGVNLLFSALINHPHNTAVNELVCKALGSLSTLTLGRMAIMEQDRLALLLTVFSTHLPNADITGFACMALANLADDREAREAIVAQGGLELVYAALRDHPAHRGASENSCRAVAILDFQADTEIAAVKRGLDALFAALRVHFQNSIVSIQVCSAIAELAGDAKNHEIIKGHGGLDALFASFNSHPTNIYVYYHVVRALADLAKTDAEKRAVVAKERFGGILAAVGQCLRHDLIVDKWCHLVGNLATVSENRLAICLRGGLGPLFDVLRTYSSTFVFFTSRACWALANLAQGLETDKQILEFDCINVLFAILSRFPDETFICREICRTLASVQCLNPGVKVAIVAHDGFDALLTAIKNLVPSFEEHGIRYICDLLQGLTFNNEFQLAIFSRGGFDVLLAMFKSHPSDASIAGSVCQTLTHLASNDGNNVVIMTRRGPDLLFEMQRCHSSDTCVSNPVCQALFLLASNDDNKTAIVARGGLDLLLLVLSFHSTDFWASHSACEALAVLATNADTPAVMRARGIIDLLSNAHHNCPTNVILGMSICALLANLVVQNEPLAPANRAILDLSVAVLRPNLEFAGVISKFLLVLRKLACLTADVHSALVSPDPLLDFFFEIWHAHPDDDGMVGNTLWSFSVDLVQNAPDGVATSVFAGLLRGFGASTLAEFQTALLQRRSSSSSKSD